MSFAIFELLTFTLLAILSKTESKVDVFYSFGNAKQDSVYKMVAACEREEGIGRDELFSALQSKMSKKELDESLEFLSNEGHVYSTTDEDHFKTTDS